MKRFARSLSWIVILFLVLCVGADRVLAGAIIPPPKFQAFDSDGVPLIGGQLFTYIAGTSTKKTTYSDRVLSTPNTNPVVLDSRGEADIYGSGFYKFILAPATDTDPPANPIWTVDNVAGFGGSEFTMIGDYGGDFDLAVATIGATETTLFVDATATMSTNTTVPATLKVVVLKGGSINQSTYTLTTNGPFECGPHQAFTGSGTVSFGRGFVKEFYPQWWQDNTTPGTTDMTAAIQAAIDAAIEVFGGRVLLLPDAYKITDTLHLGRGDGVGGTPQAFDTVSMTGVGFSQTGTDPLIGQGVTIDASSFLDRPAINIQGARGIELADVYIVGGNIAPETAGVSDVEGDYITGGATYGQYNPYAGVAIDGYSGTKPGSDYYPGTYEMNLSSRVKLTRVFVKYFVIGVVNHPCDSNSQGDSVILDHCKIDACEFGFGIHGSQNRNNKLIDSEISNCRVGITTQQYGPQNGTPPQIAGGMWSHIYRLFDVGLANGVFAVRGLYVEGIQTLGTLGPTVSGATKTAVFTGCEFKYYSAGALPDKPPIANVVVNGFVVFDGCSFDPQEGIFNIGGGAGAVTFDGCKFRARSVWNDRMYIGITYNAAAPIIQMYGCTYNTTSFSLPTSELNTFGHMLSIATPKRLKFTPASRILTDMSGTYRYVRGAPNNHISSAATAFTWADTDTVTFTATTPEEFAVGDILIYKTGLYGIYNFYLPALKIVSIAAGTVTADALFDPGDYDKTYAPTTIYICQREWAPGITCTGDTNSNTSITNVAGADAMLVGDFIKGSEGSGIPAKTRITDIVGTTVTISKAATATLAGVDLYFAQVTPINKRLEARVTWDPGNILDGADDQTDVTVTGAALGDYVVASFSLDALDLVLDAQVTASDTVTCVLNNNTGGAVDLDSGTLYVRVLER